MHEQDMYFESISLQLPALNEMASLQAPLAGGSYLASLLITTHLLSDFAGTPPTEDLPTSAVPETSIQNDSLSNGCPKERKSYGAYQNELYKKGNFDNM